MVRKVRLATFILVVLALLLGVTALTVAAAGPTNNNTNAAGTANSSNNAAGLMNIDLQHAMPINNQPFTIPANTVLWYSFNYTGGHPGSPAAVTVMLLNGNRGNLAFSVWTPEQAADMTNQKAIGKGTPVKLNCNLQTCPSTDLVWNGAFFASGTYYVEVFNPNSNAVTATLTVQGGNVTLQ